MTLQEVIDYVQEIKQAGEYSNATYTGWVNEIEGIVQTDVMLLAVDGLTEYVYSEDSGTVLLVRFPHDRLYKSYVCAQVDFARGEYSKYQNAMQMFNQQLAEFTRWYIENYNPASGEAITLGYYIKGDTGEGLKILGFYETTAALEAAHPTGGVGDAYGVGSDACYRYYVWDLQTETWIDNGGLSPAIAEYYAGLTEASAAAAADSKDAAALSATSAAASAGTAATKAGEALASSNNAAGSATEAESWAVGGTGTREGENTNNAEYWASVAEGVAAGGVTSFNGRSGAVVPQSGDYTAVMVGAETTAGAQAKADAAESAAKAASIAITQKGAASGVAELDAGGKVPSAQLPSYVDDVLEYANQGAFPGTGETGKIYVALDTNKSYRWSGSAYVEISQSLALGETSGTAYRGDRGKTAYDHSQATGNQHGLIPSDIGAAEASTSANVTLSSASWTGAGAPYSYTYNNANITATNPVELLPGSGITAAQLEALQGANIIGGTQTAGSIVLLAYGEAPAIDVPVTFIFRGDL